MFSLALRSVARRPGRSLATLLSAFLGATIMMAFNSMHDTAGAAGVDDVSAESLTIAASVVGGYGTLLVFVAIASTLTVNVRQRTEEMSLLRSSGATPAQIKRMVVGEAAVVAVVAVLLAVGPALLGGQQLLQMFQDTGQVAEDVDFAFGPVAISAGAGVTLLASVGAAFLAVRRATRAASGVPSRKRGRGRGRGGRRIGVGIAALLAGAAGMAATFWMDPDTPALMAAPAYGAILLSVGFSVLAPVLLRVLLGWLARPIEAVAGASGYLAVQNMRQRAGQLSGVLMPLILFTGMATVTFYMQAVENDLIKASGLAKSVGDKNVETLNFVVVGIIVVFSCIMLINSLYAETSYRGREFGQQRLAGATPREVLGMVGVEGLVLTVTGVFFGTVAGLAGLLAFSEARTDSFNPHQGLGIWLGVTAVAVLATMVTGLGTARRTVARTSAVDAVLLAA